MSPPDFAAIFELLPEPFMLLDRDLRFVGANAAYRRATSSSLDKLLGRHILDAFPHDPDDPTNSNARQLLASLERARDTGRPDTLAHIVYRVRRTPDGPPEERIWSASHTPVRDDAGRVCYILQNTVDVTELHRLRKARTADDAELDQLEAGVLRRAEDVQATNVLLDEERHRLRSLFQQAPGFVCILRGPEHVVEMANDAYYRIVGNRPGEGRPIAESIPELVGQGYVDRLDRVISTGETFVGHGIHVRLDRPDPEGPRDVVLDVLYQPILESDGSVWGIFVQGNDITGQKQLEGELAHLLERERAARADAESARAQAERANVLKDEFLATLSHELRTPLNALLGWARLLRTGALTATDATRAVGTIERNAVTLAQLVEDVLDMSRIVTGKLRLRRSDCDIAEVVRRAIEIVTPAAEARRVTIRQGPLPTATITGDADRLQQVVWNLLSNAIKYTPADGLVEVELTATPEVVRIVVRDNGIGIEPAFLPLLFERFRQGNPAFDRQHGGLGVGLALVRHLVEAHGGEVSAASDGLGTGSTFTVQLPTGATLPLPIDEPRASVVRAFGDDDQLVIASVDGVRVMVVEDNPDARQLFEHVLASGGAMVTTVGTAIEALEQFWQAPPDVLVSDLGLPGMDGLELIRHIRADPTRPGSAVPAIAVTAYARSSDQDHAIRAGFQQHLAKPVLPSELLASIAALAGRRA